MAWKGRNQNADLADLTQLKGILLQSPIHHKDSPLYQVVNSLIDNLQKSREVFQKELEELQEIINNLTPGGVTDLVVDHVVMSDGATPIPSPVDDGFGNFIYIAYTP